MRIAIRIPVALMTAFLTSDLSIVRADDNNAPQVASIPASDPEIEKLVDQLAEISKPGLGYGSYFSGTEFLPYPGSGEFGSGIIGAMRSTRSEAMCEIVKLGAKAVPTLLNHINDNRTTRLEPISLSGEAFAMDWIEFWDEYDFNSRTRVAKPEGVNRGFYSHNENDGDAKVTKPTGHAVTVGDLCFVALGQIVNRRFEATRYQPTGGRIINSPTHSEVLRKVIIDDWSTLTPESHRKMLIDDFRMPDNAARRIGAYYRLSLYYPEAVDDLVIEALAKPTFDAGKISKFCWETLYKLDKPEERKSAFDQFVKDNGETSVAGIEQQLFQTLDHSAQGAHARTALVELFGWPPDVKTSDKPRIESISEYERAEFIKALIHDESQKIGDVVKDIYLKNPDNQNLAPACLRCLASRGYADFLLEQLAKINPADTTPNDLHRDFLGSMSISKDPKVRAKLVEILKQTNNEAYFIAAMPALDPEDKATLLESAKALLAKLPADTKEGQRLLTTIDRSMPDQTRELVLAFLAPGTADRANTVCGVLWYNHPLATEILAPLLDDKRVLWEKSQIRVCDRAAQAISHTTEQKIRFDSESNVEWKDKQIERLKQYCKESKKN